MVEAQNNVCAICGNPETGIYPASKKPRRLAVDHDHDTNTVRGLLCGPCNMALGLFYDDQTRLQKAIDYLDNRKGAIRGSDFGSKAA